MFNFLKSGYSKVTGALSKTRSFFGQRLTTLFKGRIDESTLEELEQLFYEADLGITTSQELVEHVRTLFAKDPAATAQTVIDQIKQDLVSRLTAGASHQIASAPTGPTVILMVGVNGSGKTTTTAKLAHLFHAQGKKVLLVAGDTFRAAATEQLERWSQKIGVDIVKGYANADPSAVLFDALTAAKARGIDVVLIDTAGRLQSRLPLMQELEKMRKVCGKVIPDAPHETLLVLDANIGQNAVDQALTFSRYAPVSGLVIAKLDGSAKGGIVIAVQRTLGVPVKFIGVGEGAEDLEPFTPQEFVNALFE